MMRYKLFILSSIFLNATILAITPSKTDFIFHIKQGDLKKVAQDIAQGVNTNIQLGDKKETPLMLAVHEFNKVIKRKITQRKIAPSLGAVAAGSLIITIIAAEVGMHPGPKVQQYAGLILRYAKQIFFCSALIALISASTAITSMSMSFYTRRVNQRLAIIKAIVEAPGTDISIKNAQGQTALELLYSYVVELNSTSFMQSYFNKAEASLVEVKA